MAEEDDRIQRALNQAKREELRQRYGAEFREGDHTLPPDIESRWLHEIEEFERQFDQANQISVRHYVGSPPCRPLGEIPQSELAQETERLLELLRSNNIEICFGRNLSDSEMYRFITEELFAQEIADIRIDGLTLSFLYEEFHPDPVREARWAAEEFLRALFEHKEQSVLEMITTPGEQLAHTLRSFLRNTAAFFHWRADIIACSVEGDQASVRAGIFWRGLDGKTLQTISASGDAILTLSMHNGLWHVSAADLPGVSSSH